jgi:hypothetical protein
MTVARTVRKPVYATDRERAIVRDLKALPNIGPAMADDLLRLGITSPSDLATEDPDDLYARLCVLDGKAHDPCVLDTFMAVVDHAKGNPARPWWDFTPERKARARSRMS